MANPAITGIASGLSSSMENLRQAAIEERQRPLTDLQTQYNIAITKEGLAKLQARQAEEERRSKSMLVSDLQKEKPLAKYYLQYSPMLLKGKDLSSQPAITVGDYEDLIAGFTNNPDLMKEMVMKGYTDASVEHQKYSGALSELENKVKTLEIQRESSPITERDKFDKEIQKNKEQIIKISAEGKPHADLLTFTYQQLPMIDNLKYMKEFAGMNPKQKQVSQFLHEKGLPWGLAAVQGYEEKLSEKDKEEYKTQEPKHRGKDSGQPYVWNPNATNSQTGGKGAYVRLSDGKSLAETGESLMPLELKLAPTSIVKEANFTKSAMQRLKNMAKYYKPEYVGIVQGRIANVDRKLKELPPDQVKFYREFKQFNDDIVRAKEGAVIPDAMMARLEQFLNDIKQPQGNFEAQFDSIVDYTRDQGRNLNESIEGQYVSPFKKEHREFFEDSSSLLRRNGKAATSSSPQIAPAGTKAKLPNGKIVVSDGKGGWN